MKNLRTTTAAFLATLCLVGCKLSINKTITIHDGQKVRGSQNTINGNIFIGSNCEVRGDCRSVNGIIKVENNSEVEDLQTVNGRISVERDVTVRGKIESVNGPVDCNPGVKVHRTVATVNGSIDLANTIVRHDITTYNGDIALFDRSIVRGDIIVKKSRSSSRRRHRLKIEISEESVVEGNVIVKDRYMDVQVILSQNGKLNGRLKNAELIEK